MVKNNAMQFFMENLKMNKAFLTFWSWDSNPRFSLNFHKVPCQLNSGNHGYNNNNSRTKVLPLKLFNSAEKTVKRNNHEIKKGKKKKKNNLVFLHQYYILRKDEKL